MEKKIQWEKELKTAQLQARAETKPILLSFHNPN